MADEQVYDFGVRLRQLREERGLSQNRLAQKLGVSKQTVYRYENNANRGHIADLNGLSGRLG